MYRLFAQVVVDAVDLFLSKNLRHLPVEFFGRGQIMPKGLFDDDARPTFAAAVESCRAETLDNFWILAGRRRKVKNAVAVRASISIKFVKQVIELFVAFGIVKIGLQVMNARGEAFPDLRIDGLLTRVLIDGIERLLAKYVIRVGTPCEANH